MCLAILAALLVLPLCAVAAGPDPGSPVTAERASAQSPPLLEGKALFHEKCAMCHGPGGMGTGLLQRRVQPAELAQRTHLIREQVIALARAGVGNMPAMARGEVSDAQLAAIADFLVAGPGAAR